MSCCQHSPPCVWLRALRGVSTWPQGLSPVRWTARPQAPPATNNNGVRTGQQAHASTRVTRSQLTPTLLAWREHGMSFNKKKKKPNITWKWLEDIFASAGERRNSQRAGARRCYAEFCAPAMKCVDLVGGTVNGRWPELLVFSVPFIFNCCSDFKVIILTFFSEFRDYFHSDIWYRRIKWRIQFYLPTLHPISCFARQSVVFHRHVGLWYRGS